MNRNTILILIGTSILVAILASFFASANPDGLEKVAEVLGFGGSAIESTSIMTDYTMPGIKSEVLSTALAGITGILLVFGLFYFIKQATHDIKR